MVNVTKLCLLATAWAGAVLASNTVTDGVRTIAGELVTVAVESDLDGDGQTAGKVVLTEGGRAGCGAGRRLRGGGTGAPDLALLLQQRHAHRREVTR